MALVLQILLAILILVGLVAVFLSAKNWHWSQFVLIMFIMFTAVGFLFLAAETIRIHRALRGKLPPMQTELGRLERENEGYIRGTNDTPGIVQLEHRLQMTTRERGRAWRMVVPAGPLNNEQIPVTIPAPTPHGLEEGSVVYAFEMGDVNPANPAQGKQYLGEFRVVESREGGAVLQSVNRLDQRTGERLARSQGPWSLYESMPADRYKTFAGMDEEELRKRLPESVLHEYLHHGEEATPDDEPRNVVGFDENDQRVGPNEMDKAVRKVYYRPLRDYDFLFSELTEQKAVLLAKKDALVEDNAKWKAALASAERLSEFRQQEIQLLESDLAGMKQDRQAIEAHLKIVQRQLANAKRLIDELVTRNANLASQLTQQVEGLRQMIDEMAPAPASLTSLP